MSSPTVPGAFNVRDLGGLPVDRGAVAPGRIFRSDLLNRIDVDAAAKWLSDRNVVAVIDLRTASERTDDGAMPGSERLSSIHIPLLDEVWSWEDEHAATDEWFLRDQTIEMYEQHGDRIVSVIETIATADGPVLFHCTAGKDRTGVVASAVLGVLGAPREVIVADYARSTEAMHNIVSWYAQQAQEAGSDRKPDPEMIERVVSRAARPETMSGVLDHLESNYGSVAAWAAQAGLSSGSAQLLRSKVVE